MERDNNTVLFDIDRTLLNTDLFVERLTTMVSDISGLSLMEVNKKIGEYKKSLKLVFYFDFLTFLEGLDIPDDKFKNIKKEYENDQYIYPKYDDVIPTLEYLKRNNYKIGIFSEGVPRFQKNKVKNLDIGKYLDPKYVFIVQLKKKDHVIKDVPDGCFVVDDNIEVIHFLEKAERFQPIFLNRKGYDEKTGKAKTISSLSELKTFL